MVKANATLAANRIAGPARHLLAGVGYAHRFALRANPLRPNLARYQPALLLVAFASVASAQPTQPFIQPSTIVTLYQGLAQAWFALILPSAKTLFWSLAGIEFSWSMIAAYLEGRDDLRGWAAIIVRRVMMIGICYAMLNYAGSWIPAIINSFSLLGTKGSAYASTGPGDSLALGYFLGASMVSTGTDSGWMQWLNGSALALILAAYVTVACFIWIAIMQIKCACQGYVLVGAGVIMLALAPARWTKSFAERYIAMAISTGIRLMVVNLMVGAGVFMAGNWIGVAQQIPNSTSPFLGALDIMGSSVILASLVWSIPRFMSSIVGGTVNFTGHEAAAMITTTASAVWGGMRIAAAANRGASAVSNGATPVAQAAAMGNGRKP